LQQAGVIVKDPGTAVKLNPHFASPDSIVFFVGMLTTAILHAPCAGIDSLGHNRLHSVGVFAQNCIATDVQCNLGGA
jgi:hypothetical protein